MYDKIAGDIKCSLRFQRMDLKNIDDEIIKAKTRLAQTIMEKQKAIEKIEQYELLLMEMGIDPNEEETE